MQFVVAKNGGTQSTKKRATLAGYATLCDAIQAAEIAEKHNGVPAVFDVEQSFLELANAENTKAALSMLTAEEKLQLAGAWGTDVASIESMQFKDFAKKCLDSRPIEVAEEGAGLAVAIIAIYAVYFYALYKICQKAEGLDLKATWRQLEVAFKGKEEEALDQIVIHGWDYKEVDKALKGCENILKFMKQDVKAVFGDKYKLADIEKMSSSLWVASLQWHDDGKKIRLWFGDWREQCPEVKGDTLRNLGFTGATLVSCSERLADLCSALLKFKELQKEASRALKEHQEENKISWLGKIKRWWTETKEQKKQREQDELIISNKYYAINQLLWGFRQTVQILARQFYQASLKCEMLVKKAK